MSPRVKFFYCLWFISAPLCAEPKTSVILISIDTLRADHLSSYGYRAAKTPNIDSFAQGGTLFADIEAQVPLTLPSHTSLFTSTYPFNNHIEENGEHVPAGLVTLASVLRAQGYKTAAFIGSVFLEHQLGLDQGFDYDDSPFNFQASSPLSGSMFFGGAGQNSYGAHDRRDGALVIAAAEQWLAANRGQPVFAFVHLFDMHKPYHLPLTFHRPPGMSDYDAELQYVDHLLGVFRKTLVDRGLWDQSLVVLLSDHGESLGEHGEASHGYFVYQSTLWVPLIFHWPSNTRNSAARSVQPAGLIDVAPTILDILHLPAQPTFEGRSLLNPSDDTRLVYAESMHAHDAFGWAPPRSVRAGNYKYIGLPKPELYDLQNDPHEQNNIIRSHPNEAAALRGQLTKLLSKHPLRADTAPTQVSPQTQALLSSLGYLAPGPQAKIAGAQPDPKDRLPDFQLYEKSELLLSQRRVDEAAATLNELLAHDPNNLLARRDLCGCYLEKRLYSKARACFQLVASSAPDDYVTEFELGATERHMGRFQDAVEHLEAACRMAPDAAQCRQELDAARKQVK